MAGLPPGIRPWSGNNGRGPPGAPPGGVPPRTLPGLEGPRTRRKNGRAASANPPMKHTGPRQVEQDLQAKMALARTVSNLDRKLQRTSAEIQEKENSLLAKTGQVDVLSHTVEFQQIKLNSLDLSLKLKEKEVSTLAKQLRQQERTIRRLQRKNEKLAGKREGAGEDTGGESDTTEGSDGSGQDAADEAQLEPSATEASAAGIEGQLQSATEETQAARLAADAADAAFDRSTALAQAPVPSQSLGKMPSAVSVSPNGPAYGQSQQQADRELQDAGAGRLASVMVSADDDDGTEWFPIAAMCAVHSELSTRQPIPLDTKTCSLGQAVRILDVASLRAAIENHSVDGETTFEWAPEDAQWAGRRGVLVQVNSHGFARVDFASSGNQAYETNSSFPEGIESPGVTPGNTLDAAAFQRFQTTTSSMSSLPTIHLNETFAHLPTQGGETAESMGERGESPEALLAVPMFHSSMPTLPRISAGSGNDGMAGVHEGGRHMAATAGPLGQGSNRYPFIGAHPRSPDNTREVYSPDIEPAPSIPPPAALQQAGGSSDAEEEDAGEWFPVGALTVATAQPHGNPAPAPILKLEGVRKGTCSV